MTTSKNAGFTLIEILIVVAIVGILAAIAYPSYMDSVRTSNRSDAMASLNDASQQMQRCYTLNHTFTDCPSVGTSVSAEQFYEIVVAVTGGGTGFTATATADQAPQTGDDDCLSFTLDNLGRRTSTTNGECW